MKKEQHKFDEIDVRRAKELDKECLLRIGKRIRELRVEAGLSLNDLSFYSYLNLSTLQRLENGKLDNITTLSLKKLCLFFKISLMILVS